MLPYDIIKEIFTNRGDLMSRILKMLISLTLFFSISSLSLQSVIAQDDIKVFKNTQELYFEQKPLIQNGRTLVPIRFFSEELGFRVDWNSEKKLATLVNDSHRKEEITLGIGETFATIKHYDGSNTKVQLDVPSQIIDGRTYVPLRFVSTSLDSNLKVRWDFQNKDIYLSTTGVNLIPSDFETGNYNKELRNVEGFGKPTVTYQKFLSIGLLSTLTTEDLKYLFAQEPYLPSSDAPFWIFEDFLAEQYKGSKMYVNDFYNPKEISYSGQDIPKTNYPEITKENYDLIKEGMTYGEVENILGGPGALVAFVVGYDDTMFPLKYRWENEEKGGAAVIRFTRNEDGIPVVSRWDNNWYGN